MASRLCLIVASFYSPVRNIFPRISLHDLPCHRTMKISFRHQVSAWLVFLVIFPSPGRNPCFEHTSAIIHNILAKLTFSLSAIQINMVKKSCWFSQINSLFIRIFQVGLIFCVFPDSFVSSTYTHEKSPFSRLTNEHSQFWTFSQQCSNRTLPIAFLTRGPWFLPFVSWWTNHSDFGNFNNVGASFIFTWVLADTAIRCFSAHPNSLEIMSMTFAAVICDADDPCSVNTSYDPGSSFTMSPRSATLPLYFWYCGSNSEFLRWQRSINDAAWTFLPLFLASSITSSLFLTFVSCHAGIFLKFLPCFFHCCLCIQYF